jgi:tetratricopeptide (TPR) repeat protein
MIMSETRNVIKVFIGSPSDLNKEHILFRGIIEEVNKIKANSLGIYLEPLGWEDTLPGIGRPQSLINQDVKQSDLMVMLLWKRWGSNTGKYSSGFEEEYKLGKSLNKMNNGKPEIFLYFRSIPDAMLADPGEQLKKVLEFRKKIEKEKEFLFCAYDEEKDWERLLRQHLCQWLDGFSAGEPAKKFKFLIQPDTYRDEEFRTFKKKIKQLEKEVSKSKRKVVRTAYDLSKEAENHAKSGRITEAELHFAKAIAISLEPTILNKYGLFLELIGSLTKAEEKFIQLLEISKQLTNKFWESVALGNLGLVYRVQGNLKKAKQYHQKALKLHRELGYKKGEAADLGNLGLVYYIQGNRNKAEQYLKESLKLDRKLGYKQGEANQLGNLGNIYRGQGNLKKAEQYHQKALKLHRELGDKQGEAADLGNLGNIYRDQGNLKKAERYYQEALKLDRELGYKKGEAHDLGNLGLLYRKQGDLQKAQSFLHQAVDLLNQCNIEENKATYEQAIKGIEEQLQKK